MLNRMFASVFLTTPGLGKPADNAHNNGCSKGVVYSSGAVAETQAGRQRFSGINRIFILMRGLHCPQQQLNGIQSQNLKTFLSLKATIVGYIHFIFIWGPLPNIPNKLL